MVSERQVDDSENSLKQGTEGNSGGRNMQGEEGLIWTTSEYVSYVRILANVLGNCYCFVQLLGCI